MSITLKICDDSEEWDDLVDKSPYATIFHTWNWMKIVEEHTKSRLYPLVGFKGTTSIGIYPIFLQKRNFVNLVFSPPPKVGLLYLGPLILNYEQLKQSKRESICISFQRAVDKFILSDLKTNYARIRTSPGFLDSRPFKWTGYEVEPFYTYTVDLSKGQDQVWGNFNKQLRLDINKTEREGVSIEENDKKGLEFLYSSIFKRFEEQGLRSSISRDYLSELYDAFHLENLKVFTARYNREIVGGLIALHHKDKVSLWVGVPKTTLKGIYPNDLVQWEVIKWGCEKGYKKYELMDSGYNPRLRHFKSKYNPNLSVWFSATKHSSVFFKLAEDFFTYAKKLKL